MLRGVTERNDLPVKEAKLIAEDFRALKEKVIETAGIPEKFKRVLIVRPNQIASAFDNYFAFGEDSLERELEALMGAIIVQAPSSGADGIGVLREIFEKVGQGYGLLESGDDIAGTLISVFEKSKKLLERLG